MRIATMRWIDRWVGVPLVAMLVGLYRLWWQIVRPRRPRTIERIAFLGLSELGSTIIADPAVRRARALFPGAEIYFVIFAGNRGGPAMLGTQQDYQLTRAVDLLKGLALFNGRGVN